MSRTHDMPLPRDPFVTLLRWSEKYTKTDMVYLVQGGFWLVFGQISSSFLAFLLAVALGNFLSPSIYGTYEFVLSVASILTISSLSGISTALVQAIPRGKEGSFLEGLYTKLRWGALGTLGSVILGAYYWFAGNTSLCFAFLIIAPFIPFFQALALYQVYLNGKRLFREAILYSIIQRICLVTILVLVAYFFDALLPIIASYFVTLTTINYLLLRRTLKRFPPNTEREPSTLRYGKHLSLTDIVGNIGSYLDSILLFHFLGPVEVAVFTFARAPMDQMLALYGSIPTLAIPRLANRPAREISKQLVVRMLQLLMVGIAIGFAYALIAPFAFHLVFPKYAASVPYTQWLGVVLAVQLPLSLLSAALQSRINMLPVSWLYLRPVPQFLYIGSLLLFIPLYGIWGVIIARYVLSLARFASQFTQWIIFSRRNPT